MEIHLNEELFNSMHNIIQYQNNLLIRTIAQDYNWNVKDLKKYIKDKPKKTKINKANTTVKVKPEEPEVKIIQKKNNHKEEKER